MGGIEKSYGIVQGDFLCRHDSFKKMEEGHFGKAKWS